MILAMQRVQETESEREREALERERATDGLAREIEGGASIGKRAIEGERAQACGWPKGFRLKETKTETETETKTERSLARHLLSVYRQPAGEEVALFETSMQTPSGHTRRNHRQQTGGWATAASASSKSNARSRALMPSGHL